MRFLYYSALCVLSCVSVSSVSAVCTGDKTPTGGSGGDVPLKGGTPSANAIPLFYTFGANSGAFTNGIKNGGLGGLEGADFFCNYEADAARGATSLLQARKNLFKAIMSNRLTDAHERFNSVNDFTNGGIIHDVVDSNNACLVDSVGSLIVSGWNFNQVLPDGKGALADAAATIESFTGTLTDWTRAVVPTGSEDAAANTVVNNAYCSASTSSTDKGWSSTTGTTKVGRMFNAINDVPGHWISATDSGCSNGLHILCLQAQPTPTSGGSGDPQFTGLQGQQYQVHGMPDEYFNLISSPDMQLNSRFAYLASGRCNYNNTECWTHPGTYVDQLGFMFPGLTIKAIAGSHDDGMTLYVNDKHIIPSSTSETTHHTIHSHHHHQDMNSTQIISITYSQHDKLIVQAPLFTVTATNSDMFFNFGVSLHSPWLLSAGSALHRINDKSGSSLYPSFPLHGLLGQSWKNARYQHGRMFAGTVDDYMLLDSKLMSTKFIYNQYKH